MATIVIEDGETLHVLVNGSENTFSVSVNTEEDSGLLVVKQTGGTDLNEDEERTLFEDPFEGEEEEDEEEGEEDEDGDDEGDGDEDEDEEATDKN